MSRRYYHLREGEGAGRRLGPEQLRRLTKRLVGDLWDQGYFQQRFGVECQDDPDTAHRAAALYFEVDALLPIDEVGWLYLEPLSDAEVLGFLEAAHDVVSAPVEDARAEFHSYNGCGWHYATFDQARGREVLRERANRYLALFEEGYVLDETGTMQLLLDAPAGTILESELPAAAPVDVRAEVERAVKQFRRGTSSWDDREGAVLMLARAVEPLRERAKARLGSEDEKALFRMLNEFAIRHLNRKQKADYDRRIFLTWLFYELLASIHACLRLGERSSAGEPTGDGGPTASPEPNGKV